MHADFTSYLLLLCLKPTQSASAALSTELKLAPSAYSSPVLSSSAYPSSSLFDKLVLQSNDLQAAQATVCGESPRWRVKQTRLSDCFYGYDCLSVCALFQVVTLSVRPGDIFNIVCVELN